jgi:hypothetical protein
LRRSDPLRSARPRRPSRSRNTQMRRGSR